MIWSTRGKSSGWMAQRRTAEVPSKTWKILENCRGWRNSVWFAPRTAGSTGAGCERTLLSTWNRGNVETVEILHVEGFGGVVENGAGALFAENNRGKGVDDAGVCEQSEVGEEPRIGHAAHSTRHARGKRGRGGPGEEGGFVEGGSAGNCFADSEKSGFPRGAAEVDSRFEGVDGAGGGVDDLHVRGGRTGGGRGRRIGGGRRC